MAWRDRYLEGSFRGVPFKTVSAITTVGQRKAIYELPFNDAGVKGLPLGKKARRYQLTVFVIGGDYDRDRDKLMEAIEAPGPGLLVHPYLGNVMVEVEAEISVSESTDSGGFAEFSFSAVQSQAALLTTAGPAVVEDTRGNLQTTAAAVIVAGKAEYVRNFSLQDVRDYVQQANLDTLDNMIQDLRELNATVSSALAVPAQAAYQISQLASQSVQLIFTPVECADAVEDALAVTINALVTVASAVGIDNIRPESQDVAAVDAIAASTTAITLTTQGAGKLGTDPEPDGQAYDIRRNHAALKHLMRSLALATTARASGDATYDSSQQALDIRDALVTALEDEAASIVAGIEHDADAISTLQDLRAAVFAHLSALELQQLTTYVPADVTSSLQLAYELYGDASRFEEIERRNQLDNPNFVVSPVQVLAN
jgi:prophage DNA circulation protein